MSANLSSISGWLICSDVIRLFPGEPNTNNTEQRLRSWNSQGKGKRGRPRNSRRRSIEGERTREAVNETVCFLEFQKVCDLEGTVE